MRRIEFLALGAVLALLPFLAASAATAQTTKEKAKDSPAAGSAAPAGETARDKGWWTDDKGLTWTTKDNGVGGLTWHEAAYHCKTLELGGFSDWRLPAIDDLDRMYDGSLPEKTLRVRPPRELSKETWWIWSGTVDPSNASQVLALAFHTGKRYSFIFSLRREHGRVLCVRRAGA